MKRILIFLSILFLAGTALAFPPTPPAPSQGAVAITGGTITGITDLAVPDGGTGASTLTDGGILVGAGAAAIEAVPVGLTTEILVGGGAATNPVWTTATGSGAPVRATSPTLVTPVLGTPTSGTLTNATGLPLTTGVTGTLPVANGGTGVTSSTGTGAVVLSTSPTLVTPVLGTPASGDLSNTTLLTPPIIGKTTPAEGWLSPSVAKGPAIINSGFTGTISRSTTTLTFSAAADAILAGYSATNPILGTTVIHPTGPVTMYITAWIGATSCTVDSSGTLAAQTPTSFQLPIATFVDSSGVTQGWMNAAGNVYFVGKVGIGKVGPSGNLHVVSGTNNFDVQSAAVYFGSGSTATLIPLSSGADLVLQARASNLILGNTVPIEYVRIDMSSNILTGGLTAAGTSAAKVIAIGEGTAPTTAIANGVQKWSADYNGGAGDNRLHFMGEAAATAATAIGSGKVSVKGAVASAGGYTRQLAEAVSGALSGASGSIAVNVPTGARILGVQLRVDTLITAVTGVSWTAVYVNTPTTAICAAQTFTKNTKFNTVHPAYEITTGTVTITITPDAGTFTAGVIRAIVYYEAIDAMSDAA